MKTSQLLLATLREAPGDAEIQSHQLMLRAGLIRKLSAGLYTWLPLGLRVLKKVEAIVHSEMQTIGCQEILMPSVQPAELWQETGRWEQMGPLMLKMQDRHQRSYCFGPTHEEVVSDLARQVLHSYKQLPCSVYQIQTKFRDEIRPRFGVMRAREFLMKDAYSFHLNPECLQQTYQLMYEAYVRICTRLGLQFRAVFADTGSIGGHHSHEFHVLADSGEDLLAYTEDGSYAANVEMAAAHVEPQTRPLPQQSMRLISVPGIVDSIQQADHLKIPTSQLLKTFLFKSERGGVIALMIGADSSLNPVKIEKLPGLSKPCVLLNETELQLYSKSTPGFLGPIGLKQPLETIYADLTTQHLSDFYCGSNQTDQLLQGVNWGMDLPEPIFTDIRKVQEGDLDPISKQPLKLTKGIEVGHVFQLGKKYSEAMQVQVLDAAGKTSTVWMGCYGFGVSRVIAATIEQNHDARGIIWSDAAIAPFSLVIVPIQGFQDPAVLKMAQKIHQDCIGWGIDCLIEDRNERPGVVFADMDLIGIPHRLVVSPKGLQQGQIEYKNRTAADVEWIPLAELKSFIFNILGINP